MSIDITDKKNILYNKKRGHFNDKTESDHADHTDHKNPLWPLVFTYGSAHGFYVIIYKKVVENH